MCEKEIQLIAIICLFDFVCGTQNLVSSFDFQEGHLDNPVQCFSLTQTQIHITVHVTDSASARTMMRRKTC